MFGLSALQVGGISLAIGAAVSGALCWNIAYGRGYSAASVKAEIVIDVKNRDIATLNGDLAQCRQANGNYHTAVADQLRILHAELVANMAKLEEAGQKNALADRRMLDAATKSAENAIAAREAILNAADSCIRAGVPAEFVGVLNSILPPRGGIAAGGDPVPGGGRPN